MTPKRIGLIGGAGWPSTILYYQLLNEMITARTNGAHAAEILLYSIDYPPLKQLYHEPAGWEEIPQLLKAKIEQLLLAKPDCLVLCNMTLHRAYDAIAAELDLQIPFFHAAELTAKEAVATHAKDVLLLANAFTMEDGFFAEALEAKNISVTVPNAEDRAIVTAAQTELVAGHNSSAVRDDLFNLLRRYHRNGAVVLACTELPMAIDHTSTDMTIINPLELQCRAAVDFALAL